MNKTIKFENEKNFDWRYMGVENLENQTDSE